MKIISKYKEYYDGGSAFGVDEKVTFVRTINQLEEGEKIIVMDLEPLPSRDAIPAHNIINYSPFILGFCGKINIGYKITKYFQPNKLEPITEKIYYIYNENIIDELEPIITEKAGRFFNYEMKQLETLKDALNNWVGTSKLFDYYSELQTPYFIIDLGHPDIWARNGLVSTIKHQISLTDIQFYNVSDMMNTFQQISMFLPTLKPEPISEMTDEQKIHSHGLDETSFRCQAPGNKKERRKKNKRRKRKKQ